MAYVLKAEVRDPHAPGVAFEARKTMYGGRRVAKGDTVYLFASGNESGRGLIAKGVVASARAVAKIAGVRRQTPRVDLTVEGWTSATPSLGRAELTPFSDWNDGRPETELNFKLCRQATDKLVGIGAATAAFLETFF